MYFFFSAGIERLSRPSIATNFLGDSRASRLGSDLHPLIGIFVIASCCFLVVLIAILLLVCLVLLVFDLFFDGTLLLILPFLCHVPPSFLEIVFCSCISTAMVDLSIPS